jgi:hypothetical protein
MRPIPDQLVLVVGDVIAATAAGAEALAEGIGTAGQLAALHRLVHVSDLVVGQPFRWARVDSRHAANTVDLRTARSLVRRGWAEPRK